MATLLKSGRFFIGGYDIPFQSWVESRGHRAFDYPIGMPLFLLPFIYAGWQAGFGGVLLCHLAGALYFDRLLKVFKLNQPFLFMIYLFYPASVFYSRTLMSDIPAAVCFLAGVYYYYTNDRLLNWKMGLFFGLSILLRPSGLIYELPFLAVGFFRNVKRDKTAAGLFAAAFTCPLAILFAAQYFFYGAPFVPAHVLQFSQFSNFSIHYFLRNAKHYLPALILSYPFMLFAPLKVSVTKKTEMLSAVCVGLVFFSLYSFHDQFQTPLQTWILGVRFLLPAVALLLLMYAEVLNCAFGFLKQEQRILFFLVLIFGLICSGFYIHKRHQLVLQDQLAMKKAIYEVTPENAILLYDLNAAELMQASWGRRQYVDWRIWGKDMTSFLESADFNRGVFVVKRDGMPGDFSLEWMSDSDIDRIRKRYQVRQTAKQGGVEIFQFYEPNR